MHRPPRSPVSPQFGGAARPASAQGAAPGVARIARPPVRAGLSPLAFKVGALLIFLSISRSHLYIAPLKIIRFQLLLIVLATILLLRETRVWRPQDLWRHWIGRMIALIFAIAVAGVPFALNDGRAFRFLFEGFLPTLVIGTMAFAMARTPQGAFLVTRTLTVSGVTTVVLALIKGNRDFSGRLSGAFTYDANDLALIVVLTIPLIVWWSLEQGNRFRLLMLATLPMMLNVLLRTSSRGGLLALAATVIGFLYISRSGVSPRLRKASLLAVVGAIVAIPFIPGTLMERMLALTNYEEDYNATSESGRLQVWRRGMGYAFTHPITGVGIENFPVAEGTVSDALIGRDADKGIKWSVSHNSFVQVAAELGLIAGVTFILLLLRTIRGLYRSYSGQRRLANARAPDLLMPLLSISFVGFAVGGFFLSMAYTDILYVMYGLAAALLTRPVPPSGPAPPPRPSRFGSNGRVRIA